jgi:hypothetical protein
MAGWQCFNSHRKAANIRAQILILHQSVHESIAQIPISKGFITGRGGTAIRLFDGPGWHRGPFLF